MNSTTTAVDPIEGLPYELWLKCLYFASSDSNGPLPFLFLSRQWSQTILEEPTLWTTIALNGRGQDELARLHTFLHLSRGCLLDIILNSPEHDYAMDSIELIVSQAQRIRSITATGSVFLSSSPEDIVIKCFTDGISCYPQLRRFDIDGGDSGWSKMISLCPILQTFRNVHVPPFTALPSKLQDIATIKITSLDEAFSLMQKEGLKYLGIDYASIGDKLSDGALANHAYQLSQGDLHQITRLKVNLEIPLLKMLSTIVSALPQLQSLSVTIWEDRSKITLLEYLVVPNALSISVENGLEIYAPIWPLILQFQTPNLLLNHLSIHLMDFDEINSATPEKAIKTRWPVLQKISLWGEEWCKTLVYVDSLLEVFFEEYRAPLLDGFLLDLLRNPKACPNLRIIKSRNYPRWELLFEVMRRRNKINTPIKQLSISGYPAPAILKRLVLLLQGQTDVYTERDIDEVVYKRFRGEVAACRYCTYLGYTGCVYSSEKMSEEHYSREAVDLFQLCGDSIAPPARPQDTKRWESVTTIEEWYEMHPKLYPPEHLTPCRRFPFPSLVDITGSTLDGIYGLG